MMKFKNMPKIFWLEAVACVVNVLNTSPTRNFKGKTPYKTWSGKKPGILYLRAFSYIAFTHIPDPLREKFEDKAEKGIFIRFSSITKGYILCNPTTGKNDYLQGYGVSD